MAESHGVTVAERTAFEHYLRRVAPLADEDIQAVLRIMRLRVLVRGEFLLRAGERATQTGVVVAGLLREYFVMADGTERTKAFLREAQSTGSLADLLSDQPSRAFILAEEPARMLALDYAHMGQLVEPGMLWDAVRPAVIAADPQCAGDEAAFCAAYGGNRYALDLRQ
jgi:CRP-like cAMP-binding protein